MIGLFVFLSCVVVLTFAQLPLSQGDVLQMFYEAIGCQIEECHLSCSSAADAPTSAITCDANGTVVELKMPSGLFQLSGTIATVIGLLTGLQVL
jgi:hypothetical protein